jgi:hypothetical protein
MISCELYQTRNIWGPFVPLRMLCPKEVFAVVPVAAEVSGRSWSVVARGVDGSEHCNRCVSY